MNAPYPPHWTLNSCSCGFRSVWVYLGLFHYCMKLDAKRAQLVQLMHKFVPQSRDRTFRNERTRSTTFDPKLIFSCVSWCLGAFGIFSLLTKLGAKWDVLVQLMQKFVPRSCVGIFSQRTHPIHPIGP